MVHASRGHLGLAVMHFVGVEDCNSGIVNMCRISHCSSSSSSSFSSSFSSFS